MKITVIGGSGFLGSHVADILSRKGHKVIIFDKKKSKWIKPGQKMRVGNLLNPKNLSNVIKGADVVFHFAALANIEKALKEPINTVNVNILGTVQALEMCRKYNVKRFVHASTIYVNSSEGGFYRSSKKAAEDYVEEYHNIFGTNYTILRFGSLYGVRSDNTNGITNIINDAVINRKISYVGSKNSVREYIHVLDAAKACADILKEKYKNQHIILTGKKRIKVYDFLRILAKFLNIKNNIKFLNKKYTGHYTISPFTYKPKIGKKFIFKSSVPFEKGLFGLVENIKRKKN